MLNTSATLRHPLVKRHTFDPTDPTHLESMDVFLKTGNWGSVQFYPELPFVEVPITVLTKYALHQRKVQVENATERSSRLATKNLSVPVVETKEARTQRLAASSQRTKEAITAMKAEDKAA